MADQGGQQPQVNGSAQAAPEILDRPNNVGIAQSRIRQQRASTLAALEDFSEPGDEAPAPKAKAAPRAKAPTDPNAREAAARLMREREQGGELAQLKSKYEQLEAKLAAKDQAAQFESHKSAYLEHAVKTIGDDAPVARALAAKNPAKLRAALWAVT